jgi:poly(beta-D-mannuronate) lyase
MVVKNNSFTGFKGTVFNFGNENDSKGYYNVEHLSIFNNTFENGEGQLLTMLRSGKDESTMGPFLYFKNNSLKDVQTADNNAAIYLFGTQNSWITNNTISNVNSGKQLVVYEDAVKAKHIIENNTIKASGSITKNKYVLE